MATQTAPRSRKLVIGVGDPVMDTIVAVDSKFVETAVGPGGVGGCIAVHDYQAFSSLLDACKPFKFKRVPGGSAANVVCGLAALGHHQCIFLGKVGVDELGSTYSLALEGEGVVPWLVRSDKGTASAETICLVTPDGQRTMRTFLGAAAEMSRDDVAGVDWADHPLRHMHLEGYQLYRVDAARAAIERGRAKGASISLDLASMEVIRHKWDALHELLSSGCVDVIFGNEDEAAQVGRLLAASRGGNDDPSTVTANGTTADSGGDAPSPAAASSRQASVQRAMDWLSSQCAVAVVTLGPKGAMGRVQGQPLVQVPAVAVPEARVVDTTGAGDLFCAVASSEGASSAPPLSKSLVPSSTMRLGKRCCPPVVRACPVEQQL
eukprot:jgi/Mesvir1/5851/Mv00642-RA.2